MLKAKHEWKNNDEARENEPNNPNSKNSRAIN